MKQILSLYFKILFCLILIYAIAIRNVNACHTETVSPTHTSYINDSKSIINLTGYAIDLLKTKSILNLNSHTIPQDIFVKRSVDDFSKINYNVFPLDNSFALLKRRKKVVKPELNS